MKRVGLWTIGIGMLFIVGILTVKQGYAQECSLGHGARDISVCRDIRTTSYLPQ